MPPRCSTHAHLHPRCPSCAGMHAHSPTALPMHAALAVHAPLLLHPPCKHPHHPSLHARMPIHPSTHPHHMLCPITPSESSPLDDQSLRVRYGPNRQSVASVVRVSQALLNRKGDHRSVVHS